MKLRRRREIVAPWDDRSEARTFTISLRLLPLLYSKVEIEGETDSLRRGVRCTGISREDLAVDVVQIMARGKGKRLSDLISERTEESNQIAVVFFSQLLLLQKVVMES